VRNFDVLTSTNSMKLVQITIKLLWQLNELNANKRSANESKAARLRG
jgi:hypothetical protein